MKNKKIQSILVIDDDRDDFDLVAEAIGGIDPVISVSYLNSCDDKAKCRPQDFDLVLLDINMPSHDGFYCLKGFRDSGFDLPIVMYTNSASPVHVAKAYNEGATLYFNKPESFSLLVNGLKKLLDMDWSNPFFIRDAYMQNGQCRMFDVA